jgi:GNAT superfamily N-acetyltransferase
VIAIVLDAPGPDDLDILHPMLAATYWSPDIPRGVVARASANSLCAIGRDGAGRLVGFARVVSDRATFAWLCDVIVDPAHQRQGIARRLVSALRASQELSGLRRWLLATRDAHGVYAPLGFAPLAAPERWMEIKAAAPYGSAAG